MSNLITELNKFHVDTKGNLSPVKFHLNHDFFQLKVERLDPLTPSPKSPLSPSSPSERKRRSFTRFSWQSRDRKSFGLTAGGNVNGGLKSDILIELCHIKDLRASPFDHKIVNPQALKKLKNNLLYGRRHESQFKLLVLLYGNEFNLKRLTFLVVEPASAVDESVTHQSHRCQKRQNKGILELWITELQGLISKCIGLSYFEQLELWLKKEYHRTNSISTDNHRLKIWKQFLTRHRLNMTIHGLGTCYSDIEPCIESYRNQRGTGSVEKTEFELTARCFLHSPQSISAIFEIFSLTADQSNVFRVLEESDEAEIQQHEFIPAYMDILERFLNYLKNYEKCLPDMISELDFASPYIKAVIQKFVACIQGSEQHSLLNEHWLSSHFILDYLFSEDNSIWDPKCNEINESEMDRPFSHYWIATSHNPANIL